MTLKTCKRMIRECKREELTARQHFGDCGLLRPLPSLGVRGAANSQTKECSPVMGWCVVQGSRVARDSGAEGEHIRLTLPEDGLQTFCDSYMSLGALNRGSG